MAHESFEDQEVAELLNTHYVAIKIDREERPDIDYIYMSACQAITGQGGWPLTIIMTYEQKPFFAGTYFPKNSRYNMTGLIELLTSIHNKWDANKNELLDVSEKLTGAIKGMSNERSEQAELSRGIVKETFKLLDGNFDEEYGGIGKSPKFPTPHNLMFLLRYYYVEKNERALYIVEKTLQQMYKGGIFDHVGFGFSRYSTDNKWLVPHFEKMLYDNALLVMVYLEAYQITKKELYKTVAEKTMAYVERELTDPEGGFYCAQDADSEGVEGKYYVFEPNEIIGILGKEDGDYFNKYYNVTAEGNFEGSNILNLIDNENFEVKDEKIEKLSQKVYNYRLKRTSLHKDDKILTSWNALMIAAFAKAYKIIGDEKYLKLAKRGAQFIEDNLTDCDGDLYVRYREGHTLGEGYLEDYAFLIWALIEMYEATYEVSYLEKAINTKDKMIEGFWDEDNGGFYLNNKKSNELIYRPKEIYDGAIPSGNSVAALNIIKLARYTGNSDLEEIAYKQFESFSGTVQKYPAAYSVYVMGLTFALYPTKEVICVTKDKDNFEHEKAILSKKFMPNITTIIKDRSNADVLDGIAEFTKEYKMLEDKTTYYVCKNNTCLAPFHERDVLEKNLII